MLAYTYHTALWRFYLHLSIWKIFLMHTVMYQTGPGEIEQEISQQIICLSPLQWALESQRLYFSCLWPQFLHIADIQSRLLKKEMTEQACEEGIISTCERGNGLDCLSWAHTASKSKDQAWLLPLPHPETCVLARRRYSLPLWLRRSMWVVMGIHQTVSPLRAGPCLFLSSVFHP